MPLTPEQNQALNELLRHVPKQAAQSAPTPPGWLQTWLGLSDEQVQSRLLSLITHKDKVEGLFLDWVEKNPMDSTFMFLGAAAAALYRAEKEINPAINSFTDAFFYLSICVSGGSANLSAMTPTGKAIASLVMTIGPAMTAKSLDRK
ncbi:MAG: hypothetical protein KJ063_24675 [Anaerolineae bacterium]|nr:hypothetical protein [Anaerolineae bacterium]